MAVTLRMNPRVKSFCRKYLCEWFKIAQINLELIYVLILLGKTSAIIFF